MLFDVKNSLHFNDFFATLRLQGRVTTRKIQDISNVRSMFTPIGDHVLVKPDAKEEITKSGIVLPGSAQEKPQTGRVIAVGTGKHIGGNLVTFESQGIKEGVTVMFSKYGPTEISLNDEDYYILEMHDILGIIKK